VALPRFAEYALASSVAGALQMLISPVGTVAFPRLNHLAADSSAELAREFHRFARLAALMVAPAAASLTLFAEPIVLLWTRDAALTHAVAPFVSLLALAALLNALMSVPYLLPVVRGRPRVLVLINLAFVCVFVPAMAVGIPAVGPIAAAWAWVAMNAVGAALAVPMIERHLQRGEGVRWLLHDALAPALVAFAAAGLARLLLA
jgi:O-antigen/teichoic acid export membrane protein